MQCNAAMIRIRLPHSINDDEIRWCSQTQTYVGAGMMPRLCQDEDIETPVFDLLVYRRRLINPGAGQRLNVEPSDVQ